TGSTLSMVSAVRGTISPVNEEPDVADVPSTAFRFSDGQWIFNMATNNLTAGTTYTFRVNLLYGDIAFGVGVTYRHPFGRSRKEIPFSNERREVKSSRRFDFVV